MFVEIFGVAYIAYIAYIANILLIRYCIRQNMLFEDRQRLRLIDINFYIIDLPNVMYDDKILSPIILPSQF